MNWYNQIEEPVRELVKLLRNNGFNTICSCGHNNPQPYVQMEWYIHQDIQRLYGLLWDNGYKNFELKLYWPSSGKRFMEIKLIDATFSTAH